jgi:hypothetical protein
MFTREGFPNNLHGYYVTFNDSFGGRTIYLWTNALLKIYLVEWYMKTLKDYVRTYARPEASMAKGYVMSETLGYCTEYMQRF